jgi:hypothetical protein
MHPGAAGKAVCSVIDDDNPVIGTEALNDAVAFKGAAFPTDTTSRARSAVQLRNRRYIGVSVGKKPS